MTDRKRLLAQLDRLAMEAIGQPPALGPAADRGDERTVSVYLDDARSVQDVDAMPEGETRLLGFKRLIMRVGQLFLHRQARYNSSVTEAVAHLNDQLALTRNRLGAELGRLHTSLATLDTSFVDVEARLQELRAYRDPELQRDLDALHQSNVTIRAELNALSADIERAVADLRTISPPGLTDETVDAIERRASGRAAAFYERFEDAMRGSVESVKERLEVYLPDLEQRRSLGGAVIDIGCGRGEWLDLVTSHGFKALGIDTNEEAIKRCHERGLDAVQADAIAYLRDLEPASALAVTGFHIVEHLHPDVQIDMVEAAWRALKPGGLLILETPNPTNLNVGAASFYSDPSHLRPVDPDFLYFVYNDLGFVGVEVRYLNPREDYQPIDGSGGELESEVMRVLRGPRDFAVIGRKPGLDAVAP